MAKRIAWNKGKKGLQKHSEETKIKIGNFSRGKTFDEIHGKEKAKRIKKNISLGHMGIPNKNNNVSYDFGKRKLTTLRNRRSVPISNLVWCRENQIHKVPFTFEKNKCLIHHIDGNRENNNINNLQLMTTDFHIKLHMFFNKMRGENEIENY